MPVMGKATEFRSDKRVSVVHLLLSHLQPSKAILSSHHHRPKAVRPVHFFGAFVYARLTFAYW